MKTHINLFSGKNKGKISEILLERIQFTAMICSGCIFIGILIIGGLQIKQQREINALLNEKQQLSTELSKSSSTVAKISIFANKYDQMQTFLKDDSEFYPYYLRLNDLLSISTGSGQLRTMVLDKTKATNFTVHFNDYSPMTQFLKYAESDVFLKNFSELSLNSFSLVRDTLQINNGYELTFSGKFVPLNEKNNSTNTRGN